MELPLQISFRHMDRSETIEALIQERAVRLDTFAADVTSCRVVVQPAGKHHAQGNLYEVRLDITVPGEEVVVTRCPRDHAAHRDLHVAIRDAFDAASRQLEEYVRRRRRFVKTLEGMPHARVSKLAPEGDYGFLTTTEGREIYFHRHSVVQEAFDALEVGAEVAFVEQEGEKGPQASTVRLVGRAAHR